MSLKTIICNNRICAAFYFPRGLIWISNWLLFIMMSENITWIIKTTIDDSLVFSRIAVISWDNSRNSMAFLATIGGLLHNLMPPHIFLHMHVYDALALSWSAGPSSISDASQHL